MPIRTFTISDFLNAFIDEVVESDLHSNPDGVVLAALERYQDDISAERDLVAKIDSGKADTSSLEALLDFQNARYPGLEIPITPELMARMHKLMGPYKERKVDLDKPTEGDANS